MRAGKFMSLYNYTTNGIYFQSYRREFSQLTHSIHLGYPWNFFRVWKLLGGWKLLLKRRAIGSSEAMKNWHKGCFDLDLHCCSVMFVLRGNWTWWICELLSFSVILWGSSPHMILAAFDTFVNTVQLKVRITAELKKSYIRSLFFNIYFYLLSFLFLIWIQVS